MGLELVQLAANGGALLVHLALKATVLLLVALAVLSVLRRSSAALRHTIWSVCCLGLLALPAFTIALPAWQPTLGFSDSAVVNAEADAPLQLSPAQETTSVLMRTIAAGYSSSAPVISTEQWALAALFGCWLLGMVVATRKLALGFLVARRLQHRGRLVEEGELWQEFMECATALGLRSRGRMRAPRLVLVDDEALPIPLTWGWWRPVVLMPRASLGWSASCRRAALLHELSHIRRLDWLIQSLASLTCLLYWFHPLAWFAAQRLRLESERATDDHVLTTGLKATDYSSSLLEIVRFVGSHREGGTHQKDSLMKFAVPVAGSSKIELRLRSLLDPKQSRVAVSKPLLAAVSLFAFATVVPLAAAKEPAEPQLPNFQVIEAPLNPRIQRTGPMLPQYNTTGSRIVKGFKFTGNTSLTSSELQKVLVSKTGGLMELENVKADTKAIQKAYADKGVSAKVSQVAQDQTGIISYVVQEFRIVTGFKFTGNTALTADELQKVLTSKTGVISNQPNITADVLGIEKAYSDKGLSVVVQNSIQDETGIIAYNLHELPVVTGFKFTGNTALTADDLQKVLVSKTGVGRNQESIKKDVIAIQKVYWDKGYPVLVKNSSQDDAGVISYDLLESKLTEIKLSGLTKTDPQEVRKLITTPVNQPLDMSKLRLDVKRIYGVIPFEDAIFKLDDDPDVQGGVIATFVFKEKTTSP